MAAVEQPGMPFDDVVALLESIGFRLEGMDGAHRIYRHPEVPRPFLLAPEGGKAKACEVGELLEILDRYDLPGIFARAATMPRPELA